MYVCIFNVTFVCFLILVLFCSCSFLSGRIKINPRTVLSVKKLEDLSYQLVGDIDTNQNDIELQC